MNISFEYYKVFYQVAQLGSITLAAKALFLSQPAVSKCIRQLEKLLGCTLFYRMHKGMRLTPEGEVLYQHVAQACEQIAIGEKKIQAMLHLDWGSIHIGSSDIGRIRSEKTGNSVKRKSAKSTAGTDSGL